MPTHVNGISTFDKEQPFTITFETTEIVTRTYTGTVWAEDMEDAEALAENEFSDGHVLDGHGDWRESSFVCTERTLEGISVKRGK